MGKFTEGIADAVKATINDPANGQLGTWQVAKKISSAFAGGTTDAHGDLAGALDPYTLFTVTGDVEVKFVVGIVNTSLAGATATVEVGTASNTAKLIALSTGTNLVAGDVWTDAGAEANVDITPAGGTFIIGSGADIIETPKTANVTAGQIDYYCIWRPLEVDASVVAA